MAEIASDGQLLKTDLTRGMVNASNLAVNPRKTVLTDAQGAPYANIDDLMDFRIGGLVRQSRPDSIGMEPVPFNAT
ncbi:portal protein, partial [Propionibacterium freudenreichii]|uniref:portal protein n=1 Tax=Propionibacterium freudenreichii TaxID=1744 RepID=UPI003857B296